MADSLPSSVRIFGRPYSITKEPLESEAGLCFQTLGKIVVASDQIPLEEADTVLHETIHGIDHVLDLKLSERQVRLLATALIGVFQDNPEFAQYIAEPRS